MEPIFLVDLLPTIQQKLIKLLKSLSREQWEQTTIVPNWRVKDIAAHLLDGDLRSLSMLRDHYFGESPSNPESYEGLVKFLNDLNADWVKSMRRLSPDIIIALLEYSGKHYCDYMKSLDPFAKATFSVGWAGESESYNWFHIAREYTEKWHHQQQIRLAVGLEEELYTPSFYHPYLETSMRALPHHYRNLSGQEDDLIHFHITGKGGGDWFLGWNGLSWTLGPKSTLEPTVKVNIPSKIAWRIFTKGISREEAIQHSTLSGNQELGSNIFNLLAIMA